MQKKKSKFTLIDKTIVVLCLIGACVSGTAFWKEYNKILVKLNEEPVGTITFKKNTAQRRFIDRGVWDRLQKTSPVYNGDTIRTTEQAETVIIFEDEVTYLSLDESTMIQVFYDGRSGARIDFSGGNIEVISEQKSTIISSGTSTIVLEGRARMNKSEDEFVLAVLDGMASFDGIAIEAGNILAVDADGTINTRPVIAMTSFGSSAVILSSPFRAGATTGAFPVVFSWNSSNFSPDTQVIIEVAADRRFSQVVAGRDISGDSSVSIPLGNGNYWWRAYPASGSSREPVSRLYPSGTLELIPATEAIPRYPNNAEEFVFSGESLIPFSWSIVENASAYLLEIASSNDMNDPVVTRRVEENSIVQAGLDYGRWYWRITPVFPSRIKGEGIPSIVNEFSVVQDSAPLAAAVPSLPPITFSADIATTIADNEQVFAHIVQTLNTYSEYRLRIEGHANPTTAPGDTDGRLREQTEELQPISLMRARAIADHLAALGLDPDRLEPYGIGGERPVVAWEDTDSWWRNRRVEFILVR